MFGLLDLIGNSFLPLMQLGYWVLGLSEQADALNASPAKAAVKASAETSSDVDDNAASATANDAAKSSVDAGFFADPVAAPPTNEGSASTPPGAFPQIDRPVQSFDGAPDLSTARAQGDIDAPARVSESLAHFDETSDELSLRLLIEDDNGLSLPRLEAGALASLQLHQVYFEAPMFVEIEASLIDATKAKVTWTGSAAQTPALYLPFSMVIEDEAGFTADFGARLPVLTDGTDLS